MASELLPAVLIRRPRFGKRQGARNCLPSKDTVTASLRRSFLRTASRLSPEVGMMRPRSGRGRHPNKSPRGKRKKNGINVVVLKVVNEDRRCKVPFTSPTVKGIRVMLAP